MPAKPPSRATPVRCQSPRPAARAEALAIPRLVWRKHSFLYRRPGGRGCQHLSRAWDSLPSRRHWIGDVLQSHFTPRAGHFTNAHGEAIEPTDAPNIRGVPSTSAPTQNPRHAPFRSATTAWCFPTMHSSFGQLVLASRLPRVGTKKPEGRSNRPSGLRATPREKCHGGADGRHGAT